MPFYQTSSKSEKRVEERKRTRLRSGKLVALEGHFLTECHFHNVAGGGAKIRVVSQSTVPTRFWLFDDQYSGALIAEVVWRQNMELGVRFVEDPEVTPLTDTILRTLAGKYYSL